MIENIFVIKNHSQIKQLSSKLNYQILNELIKNPATCQQVADIFMVSKQKIHYILQNLLKEDLIRIEDTVAENNKEVYYRAKAKNYILDFSLGTSANSINLNNRELLHNILDTEHNISLSDIAANLLDNSLKMKPKESLLINTGEYNMPLVKKIIIEAAKRQIRVTLKYQDRTLVEEKFTQLSLTALTKDFDDFNKQLKEHHVYMNLNGEARFFQPPDKHKLEIQQRSLQKSLEIIKKNDIKVAIMPGLINDTLSESAVLTELNFWKAINVDYQKLYEETEELFRKLQGHELVEIESRGTKFSFSIQRIFCEYGSFNNNPHQSPIINLPGGEILMMPQNNTMNGTIQANIGYALGEKIINPRLEIVNNSISSFYADTNSQIIERAINEGGKDGSRVAFVCMGTNYNMGLENIDISYKSKTKGFLSVFWGNNTSMGGDVSGNAEWIILLEDVNISYL